MSKITKINLQKLNLITDTIDDILQKRVSKETLQDLTKQLNLHPAIMQVINIANDIFNDIDNRFGFDNDDLIASITDEQVSLLNQSIMAAEYSIKY